MSIHPTPYIGITDVPDAAFALECANLFIGTNRRFMNGLMMNHQTLKGKPNKYDAVWPKRSELADIFIRHPKVYNTLHFADFFNQTKLKHLEQITAYCGPYLHAIQLDMCWPDPDMIQEYKLKYPNIDIIVQIGPKAFSELTIREFDKALERYSNVEYFLLDKSGGKGVGLSASELEPYIYAARWNNKMPIALAGGLGPDTLDLLEDLPQKYAWLSIDAQGQLRPSGDSTKPICRERSLDYLKGALRILATL